MNPFLHAQLRLRVIRARALCVAGAPVASMLTSSVPGWTVSVKPLVPSAKLLAALDQPDQPTSILTLNREDDFWLISYGDALARVPDSLGLHYLDLLVRHPGRDLAAPDLVRQLGSDSERARLNVTPAIRSAIARIRDRAPAAADYLDQAVRTGTRCSYSPPDRAG